ncbi:MAG: ACT domain-containing protein [Dermatophilus congolensis]|nr:ACT domain-containing protein [Dermatophilus congolensis]
MSEQLIAVHGIGRDRSGLISEMTNALVPLAVYHDDPRTALLPGGNFAALVVLRTEAGLAAVEAAVESLRKPDFLINVWELDDHTLDESEKGRPLVLRIHAQGRPGIIASFTKVVAKHGGSIHDFGTRIGGGRVSVLRVELPNRTPELLEELQRDLFHMGEVTGVGIKLYDPKVGEQEAILD